MVFAFGTRHSVIFCRQRHPLIKIIQARRCLSLQEYHCKELLRNEGCTVQNFFVAENNESLEEGFDHWSEYVVKAQILAGGRGKGQFSNSQKSRKSKFGGVFVSPSKGLAVDAAQFMLGNRLITKQTTSEGTLIRKVMVAESVPIARETYLAIVLDRSNFDGPMVVASPAGGMDIEEVAEKHPELLLKEPIDIGMGITREQCLKVANFLRFTSSQLDSAADQIARLYRLFLQIDATQIEVNPLAETSNGEVYCVDAKINLDESAAFRQVEIFRKAANDDDDKDPLEERAKKAKLNYVGLNGNIGCIVNGAGLALATMDIIKLNGGEPANFMDVGGGATVDQVAEAFRIVSADSRRVRAVFVNIFGGIMRCDTIAEGLIKAAKEHGGYAVPIVARLQGTRVDVANELIAHSGLNILTRPSLQEAASLVIKESGIGSPDSSSAEVKVLD